jgi:hypothetical protein
MPAGSNPSLLWGKQYVGVRGRLILIAVASLLLSPLACSRLFSLETRASNGKILLLSPHNQTYVAKQVLLQFKLDGSASWIGYSVDGNMNVTISSEMVIKTAILQLSDGYHNVVVYVSYDDGSTGCSDVIYFTTNTVQPKVILLSPGNQTYTEDAIPLTFTIDQETSHIFYYLDPVESFDSHNGVEIDGNTTLTGLSNGPHSIFVFVRNTLGNVGDSGSVDFTVNIHRQDAVPIWVIVSLCLTSTLVASLVLIFRRPMKQRPPN